MSRSHDHDAQIESILHESRLFAPPPPDRAGAPRWHVPSLDEYRRLYGRSIADPEGFWADAAQELAWFKPWNRVLAWSPPDARWFDGARTNVCYNCVDRQVEAGLGDQVAIVWEGEPIGSTALKSRGPAGPDAAPEIRRLTYSDLQRETSRLANAMKGLGVARGDVVTIYMGMVPELAIAMLACARIGAVHSVVFGGFSSQAIADRAGDARSRVILTCDGAWRRGKVVPLKENVDAACEACPGVEHVVVLRRCGNAISWRDGRDHWWHDLAAAASDDCPAEPMDAEDMLFLLYTSGSTGKPKGIVHTTGGYMVFTYLTAKHVFNLIPDAGQLFWCTADCGWVTGHSYVVYGILPNRVPTFMYEGAPDFPAPDRFWSIVERHRVTQFYTAPTAIRAFQKWGDDHPAQRDLSSLQVLGTVGEPINPEAWMWYHRTIGGGTADEARCPIVDTYWQTETGGHVVTPLPGAVPTRPGSCTVPYFGIDAAVVNENGEELPPDAGGLFVIRKPWPGMLRGIYGDRERFISTYFQRIPGMYFAGDGARRDHNGYFWIMGRVDDVMNVAGHRLGTMEIESALVSHPAVVEAAVVGVPHEVKGTGIAAFCTLARTAEPSHDLAEELRAHVSREIGPIARPDSIRFADALPKTRSGKIMRRLLRDIAAGAHEIRQDTTTLEDYSTLARLRETDEA